MRDQKRGTIWTGREKCPPPEQYTSEEIEWIKLDIKELYRMIGWLKIWIFWSIIMTSSIIILYIFGL